MGNIPVRACIVDSEVRKPARLSAKYDDPNYDLIAKMRFISQIVVSPTGCWEWQGHLSKDGYSRFSYRQQIGRPGHRMAQMFFRNGVPDDMVIDHLCKNRKCVNPLHHEIVTQAVNVARSNGVAAINARRTICKQGHPLSGENIYESKKGYRVCKTCSRATQRKYMQRKRKRLREQREL